MSVLNAIHVSKAFGPDELFGGISVSIPNHAKIALVGPNGAGKTTLLNILIGNDEPTTGKVETKRGLRISFLPQRPKLTGNRTIWEEMLTAFEPLLAQQAKLTELEHALAESANHGDHDELLRRYGAAQEAFQEAGGYTYETEIKRVLMGLGFKPDEFSRPLTLLSGGQVTRALLARLLLENPELLVLDEPTNHLDINAVEWLEGYLKTWQGALLLVSHDRYFMDKVVNVIWELEFGELDT
ncbi:MAG: ABC-F family ATP-binding cassette domain-containing protein, partial [Anaerolineae bacterium]